MGKFLSFLFLLVFASQSWAADTYLWINPNTTWLSHEATFQDERMASINSDDHGTKYKIAKLLKMAEILKKPLRNVEEEDETALGFKPYLKLYFPNRANPSELIHLQMEPAVIEVTLMPKTIDELEPSWKPIFKAAKVLNLTHSVYEVGGGGGGGHFHIGGNTRENSPFLLHPKLLRNLLVYVHQHPSLLFGFSEGYDVGRGSTTLTLHGQRDQKNFEKAVREFDKWISGNPNATGEDSLRAFLHTLYQNPTPLFSHDVYINLQHVRNLLGSTNNKATVEVRNIRPLASAKHVKSIGRLLLHLMDYLADPNLTVPFRHYSEQDSFNLMSTALTEADWEVVKKDLKLEDPLLDDMITEYTSNPNLPLEEISGGFKNFTYSEHERRGQNLEIIKPVSEILPNRYIQYQGISYKAETFMGPDGQLFATVVIPLDQIPKKKSGSCEKVLNAG